MSCCLFGRLKKEKRLKKSLLKAAKEPFYEISAKCPNNYR